MPSSYRLLFVNSDEGYVNELISRIKELNDSLTLHSMASIRGAKTALTEGSAHILIIDCNVLGNGGMNDLREFRKDCPDVPMIIMAGVNDGHLLTDIMELDVDLYVSKSRRIKDLSSILLEKSMSLVELRKAEKLRQQNEKRMEALVGLAQTQGTSFNEVADYVLKRMVDLTDSEMGYLAFLEGNGHMLRMHAWSEKGMAKCRIPQKPVLYSMDQVGIWGEPIRQGVPMILNDFKSFHPLKRGTPHGHVEIDRYMAVPIRHNGEIVATAGVANKKLPYDESDVQQMRLLTEGMVSIQYGIEIRREIVESQAKFQALLDSLTFTVAILDNDGRIISINKTPPGMDLGPKEMIGLRVHDQLPDLADDYKRLLNDCMGQGRPVRGEIVHTNENGDTVHMDVSMAPVPLAEDEEDLFIVTINDITEIRRALINLEKASHKLKLVESMTYHDIFNQIQIMKGYVDLMASETGRNEKDLDRFIILENAADNISHQMKLFRDYYALGLTKPEWLDLESEVRKGTRSTGVNPELITFHGPNVSVLADSSFHKAFHNLIDNSIRHGRGITRISISSERNEDGSMSLIYEDDGIGIAKDEKEKIFRRGFGRNTGLGMFLVKEIFIVSGFDIVENGTKGARFEITVPAGYHRPIDA